MTATTQRWADELKQSIEGLEALRDEMKLQAHLYNMDVKQRFEALAHRLDTQQLHVKRTVQGLAAELRQLKYEVTREAKERARS